MPSVSSSRSSKLMNLEELSSGFLQFLVEKEKRKTIRLSKKITTFQISKSVIKVRMIFFQFWTDFIKNFILLFLKNNNIDSKTID